MYADKTPTELGIRMSPAVPAALTERLTQSLASLLSRLDVQVDKRLVRTFLPPSKSSSNFANGEPTLLVLGKPGDCFLMVTLAYTFLLSLPDPVLQALRQWLPRYWCHRTGKRSRETRLRFIVSDRP
jgi:hypothetical protein